MITLTDTARDKVLEFIQIEEKKGWALRLNALRKGPRRFHYELNLEAPEDKQGDDVVVGFEGFELWLDPESAENVEGATMDFVQRGFESGFKFENPQAAWQDPVAQSVQNVLDDEINPAVASHGGRVELTAVEDGVAYIAFGGGCQGCGMADVTLKQGVQTTIINTVPEIQEVRDATDHAAGTNPYYANRGDSPF